MNWVDMVVVVCVVLAAVAGFRLGFVTRVLSWIGMLLGIIIGLLVLGPLLDGADPTNHVRLTVIAVAIVLLGAFLGQAIGFVLGNKLRPTHDERTLDRADAVMGLGAGVLGAVLLIWLLVPVLTQRGGPVADEVSTSWVARQLDERLPSPPDALQAFRSIVGEDNFPDVFAELEPTPPLGPPPATTGLSQQTADSVARSVVKVEGIACRKIQDGTGFVVQDGLVATNAHVVAGEASTDVIRDDGSRISADVVAFDADTDLALLDVPGLDRPPLPLARASVGDIGGVFGHPRGEPLRVAPYEVARFLRATGNNIYDTNLVERDVLEVAAALEPGDSGSPLVSPAGEVVGVTFAISRDRSNVAYALNTTELRKLLAEPRGASAGPCVAA
jgi:S1-C subfamily serine protease